MAFVDVSRAFDGVSQLVVGGLSTPRDARSPHTISRTILEPGLNSVEVSR